MRFQAHVEVRLKPSHSDPEGDTAAKSLRDLKYGVERVRVVKVYEVTFEADSLQRAQEEVEEMCRRLLANPVKDAYHYDVVEVE
ncbi:MAG: phosphoribosylformylglycinamidine synthase subunit PurS [Candidatus Bathyarchaeota archaeon]|nr:phosphoribosylformylglycinamidine synthase subunit PurS [Candidatus Bathyarchaeota archaeon]